MEAWAIAVQHLALVHTHLVEHGVRKLDVDLHQLKAPPELHQYSNMHPSVHNKSFL